MGLYANFLVPDLERINLVAVALLLVRPIFNHIDVAWIYVLLELRNFIIHLLNQFRRRVFGFHPTHGFHKVVVPVHLLTLIQCPILVFVVPFRDLT